MRKRFLALGMALLLLSGCSAGAAEAGPLTASTENIEEQFIELDTSADVLTTDELSAYENGEVLVGYKDGSFEVFTYETEDALAAGLKTLSADENITLIQPNYAYDASVLSTDDALAAQQWALSNDGSFQMEEQANRYPVYDSPFEKPAAPGQWTMPGNFGRPGGQNGFMNGQSTSWYGSITASQTQAVAGVDINAEDAWAIYNGGSRDVVIALIDTGIDYSHEDLTDALWVNTDEIAGNGIDDDRNGYVDDVYGWNFYHNSNQVYTGSEDDHGTHGAGTIAAASNNNTGISGVVNSEHVKIMSLKALGGSVGSGTTADIIRALQYAETNGASICNLSLGSSFNDRALYQAIAGSSMLFIVAAGNDSANTDQAPCYPASYDLDNIISVANLNYDGTLHYSSNYGVSSVDLAAPGSYILSTTPGNGYSYMTGTSMAAPMVTAAAAMLYSYHEDITLADVKEILLYSAQQMDALTGNISTGGMLDLGAAMSYPLEQLTGEVWKDVEIDCATAPVITAEQSVQHGRTILTVQVTDADGDLTTTAYASGTLDASQFQGGNAGRTFSVDRSGQAVFVVSASGEYTFYACDSFRNETVITVSVTCDQPAYTSAPNGSGSKPETDTKPQIPSPRSVSMPSRRTPHNGYPFGGVR